MVLAEHVVDHDVAWRTVGAYRREHRATWCTEEGTHRLDQGTAVSHAPPTLSTLARDSKLLAGFAQTLSLKGFRARFRHASRRHVSFRTQPDGYRVEILEMTGRWSPAAQVSYWQR